MHKREYVKIKAVLQILAIVGELIFFASASKNPTRNSPAIQNSGPSLSSEESLQRKQQSDEQFSRPNTPPEGNGSHSAKQSAVVKNVYGTLPFSFEANQGQADPSVLFLSRGSNCTLFLTKGEIIIQLRSENPGNRLGSKWQVTDPIQSLPIDLGLPTMRSGLFYPQTAFSPSDTRQTKQLGATLRMKLAGANSDPQIEGLERLPGISNYFIGNDPKKWRTNIPNYSRVVVHDVYPGVSLAYYGNHGQVEFDLMLAPGADSKAIKLAYEGVEKMQLDSHGDLILNVAGTELCQHKPRIFQQSPEEKNIAGNYVIERNGQVGFQVAQYDPTQPLIIDPVLSYSAYLGGNKGGQSGRSISIDQAGNAYVFGSTTALDFPTTPGALQSTYSKEIACGQGSSQEHCSSTFVAKFSPQGDSLIYSTYLGGQSIDFPGGMAVDSQGNAYLTGGTNSTNFPITPGAFQSALKSGPYCTPTPSYRCTSAFVSKLSPQGNALLYSTYLGGSTGDSGSGIALDSIGNVYITGVTSSTDFPIAPTSHHVFGDTTGSFVVKLNSTGTALLYSVIIGASSSSAMALDAAGNVFISGTAAAIGFPTVNAFQPASGTDCIAFNCTNAFVSKIDPSGSTLIYSTYLGGNKHDEANAIAIDPSGNAYVTGRTTSTNFPTHNPLQPENHGGVDENLGFDAFVTKFNASGSALMYSTYLGGDYDDAGSGIAVDSLGNAYVTGWTESRDFPLMRPFQAAFGGGPGGGRDAFLAKLNPDGSAFVYSSYLGGGSIDDGVGLALDSSGNAYVTGVTLSMDFPGLNLAQPITGGVFVTKITDEIASFVPSSFFVPIVLSTKGLNNSFFTSEIILTNRGLKGANIEFCYTAAFGGGTGKASDTLPAGQQRIFPDAIEYLKALGVPIPDSGDRGGTLRVLFSNISTYSDVAVTVRTTTKEPDGRAGLAYPGVPIWNTLSGPSYLCGLRQNATDRSNVAIQNAGTETDGDIVLRLTVYSGDPATAITKVLPDEKLSPGGFKQFTGILHSEGLSLTNGYVRVERVSGNAPYYAYGVINDQANSDGSFIPPLYPVDKDLGVFRNLPVIVETGSFSSEVVLTNLSTNRATFDCSFKLPTNQNAEVSIELNPGEQTIIPNFIQYLRDRGVAGIGPPGIDYVGFLNVSSGLTKDVFVGARTSTPGDRGRYGVFYLGLPYFTSANSAWIYGLQQDSENRSNVAIVNPDAFVPGIFNIEIFDGRTGLKVNTVEGITVNTPGWLQINSIMAQYAPQVAQGYAKIIRSTGHLFFITYGVTNDGGHPGERTGDGAFISSSP